MQRNISKLEFVENKLKKELQSGLMAAPYKGEKADLGLPGL